MGGVGDLDLAALNEPEHASQFGWRDALAFEAVEGSDEVAALVFVFGGPGGRGFLRGLNLQPLRLR